MRCTWWWALYGANIINCTSKYCWYIGQDPIWCLRRCHQGFSRDFWAGSATSAMEKRGGGVQGSSIQAPWRPSGSGMRSTSKRLGAGLMIWSFLRHKRWVSPTFSFWDMRDTNWGWVDCFTHVLLAMTEMTFVIGWLWIQLILFCQLAGITGNCPQALLELHYQHVTTGLDN